MYLAPDYQLRGSVVHLASGHAGIMQTIRTMRRLVNAGKVSPVIRQTALNLVRLNAPKDTDGEVRDLFEFVRDRIRYVGDVHAVETVATPEATLALEAGDCDDKATLLASLLESIGIETRFVIAGYNPDAPTFEHVYLAAFRPDGSFINLDPSEDVSAGWAAPEPVILYMEGT
jgi:transglutaminase-like putative cysteine protease